eukprot:7210259-Pyramimonas_sp.AAC.1
MWLAPNGRVHLSQKIATVVRVHMASVPRTQACEGAAVTLIRGVDVPRVAFWHDSGSSRRNCQVDSWRWSPEHGSYEERLGGRVCSNIVDESWVCNGPLPPPPPPPPPRCLPDFWM